MIIKIVRPPAPPVEKVVIELTPDEAKLFSAMNVYGPKAHSSSLFPEGSDPSNLGINVTGNNMSTAVDKALSLRELLRRMAYELRVRGIH
jgi:hypothetical protein